MKKPILYILLFLACGYANAQDAVSYKTPPKEMADLLLAKPTPTVSADSKGEWILIADRNSYPFVEELARPELRIAGLRINPANYSLSRQNFISNFSLKNIKTGQTYPVAGLPMPLYAGNMRWNPAENKISFTQTGAKAVDLYVINIATKRAVKTNKQPLNTVISNAVVWVDDNTLLYREAVKPVSMAPAKPLAPKGPTVQQSLGKVAPSATFEDLIKTPYDEQLFEFYGTSQLVQNKNGVETPIGKPGITSQLALSPDKKYMLVRTIRKPFSYLVTAGGFPSTMKITDLKGQTVKILAELPSSEGTPSGNDNTQNIDRAFDWRGDEPATITWAHPLDSGRIKNKADFHDAVFEMQAPFSGQPVELFKTKYRYRGTRWGNADFAMVIEGLRSKQLERVDKYNTVTKTLDKLYERNTSDQYSDPGEPVTVKNKFSREVILVTDGGTKLLMNNMVGASARGDLPFLARFDIATAKNEILWRCAEGYYETVVDVLDPYKLVLLTRRESQTEVPNYYIKNLTLKIADRAITDFKNPYPQLIGVSKQKIKYKRADGVDLTGDLYLPKGYNKDKDGPLPVLIWAYPREFNSASDAAQVRGSQSKFTVIGGGSPVFYVTQGYAILDNAEMPILAKDGKKPNDTFVEQLSLNAEAAINKLADMGVGDRNRVAVGGHSYGAFMTANLLAHTSLFKAGIAESGAYNRTLTPFGFQNEDRTYWDDPKLYYDMSPFSFANQIKTPLLLIHGEADDNSGTFPINSERLFAAIKGLGGTVRFVYLPYEAHGYRGRENLLHKIWETNEWLNTYVKNAKPAVTASKE